MTEQSPREITAMRAPPNADPPAGNPPSSPGRHAAPPQPPSPPPSSGPRPSLPLPVLENELPATPRPAATHLSEAPRPRAAPTPLPGHPPSPPAPPIAAAPVPFLAEFAAVPPKIQFVPAIVSTRPAFERAPAQSAEALSARALNPSQSSAETIKPAGEPPSHQSEARPLIHRHASNTEAGSDKPTSAPSIHISIGRIEVQAILPPTPPVAAPRKAASIGMSLEDYLKRRNSPGS